MKIDAHQRAVVRMEEHHCWSWRHHALEALAASHQPVHIHRTLQVHPAWSLVPTETAPTIEVEDFNMLLQMSQDNEERRLSNISMLTTASLEHHYVLQNKHRIKQHKETGK